MGSYFTNEMFQITSCFALAHLFFNFSVAEEVVSQNRGIERILIGMKRYPNNESLQTTAIFALGSIVMKNGILFNELIKDVHRFAVLKADGIPLILKAMKTNFTDTNEKANARNISRNDKMASTNPEPVL